MQQAVVNVCIMRYASNKAAFTYILCIADGAVGPSLKSSDPVPNYSIKRTITKTTTMMSTTKTTKKTKTTKIKNFWKMMKL